MFKLFTVWGYWKTRDTEKQCTISVLLSGRPNTAAGVWQPTASVLKNMHCISGYSLFFSVVFHIYSKTQSKSFSIVKYIAKAYNSK